MGGFLVACNIIGFQCIPYETLLEELQIKNLRDLEDLIIEAIYAGNFCLLQYAD